MANIRKTKEQFDIEISSKYNEELESINFLTTKHSVTIRCKKCGYSQFFTKAANVLYCAQKERSSFCPHCRKITPFNKWTHEDFVNEVYKRTQN